MATLYQTLHNMKNNEEIKVGDYLIVYQCEPALGDDGSPVKGFTVGTYLVTEIKTRKHKLFRHSPYKPATWAGRARGYTVEEVISYLTK